MRNIKRVLIIAPHPDDDILGCGGILAKFNRLNIETFVAIMTNGNVGAPEIFPKEGTMQGRAEALSSHELLGIRETFFYDFPAPRLETFPSYKISIEIENLIRKLDIDTIFIPHKGDLHKDHLMIFNASLVSSRPINDMPVKRIYAYETLSETEWAAPYFDSAFLPNVFFEISEQDLYKKIEAFNRYSSPRKKEYPHPRSIEGIKSLALLRGTTISKNFAEAFALIREIV